MASFLEKYTRTHGCGELRAEHIGQDVVLTGWVQTYRDLGGAVFIDLRDRDGLTQIVFDAGNGDEMHKVARELRTEWCIGVAGKVRSRGTNANDRMSTGAIVIIAR
jgi:aspartyl-tRNA synthetase